MAIEMVDLPRKMVIFHSHVSLPEGNHRYELIFLHTTMTNIPTIAITGAWTVKAR